MGKLKNILLIVLMLISVMSFGQKVMNNNNPTVKHIIHKIENDTLIIKSNKKIKYVNLVYKNESQEKFIPNDSIVKISVNKLKKGRTIVIVRERGIFMVFSVEK